MNGARVKAAGEFRGVHALWCLIGFFAVMIAVNAVFITRAVTSFPGEDAPNSYVQGVDYNRTLQRRQQQARLGWVAEMGIEQGELVARIRDAGGQPVSHLAVTAHWRVIGRDIDETTVSLSERRAGEYAARPQALMRGRLAVAIEAVRDGQVIFSADKTLERAP